MYQRVRALSVVLLLGGLAAAAGGCWPEVDSAVIVSKDCTLVDGRGRTLTYLAFEPGTLVLWKNPTSHDAVLTFSSHKIAGGSVSIRLEAGSQRIVRVGTYPDGGFKWTLVCRAPDISRPPGRPPIGGYDDDGDDSETDGDGGPPTPKDPPPCPEPPQPCPPEE